MAFRKVFRGKGFVGKLCSKGCIKQVTPELLRDMFVVRSVKDDTKLEDALEKIGLSPNSYDYARKRYGVGEGSL